MSIIPNASSEIQLRIRKPRHKTRNRPPSRPPATKRARHIPIRKLSLQCRRPPLPTRRIPTIKHRSIQPVDVRLRTCASRVVPRTDWLSGELRLVERHLAGGDEVVGRLGAGGCGERSAGDVRGERP
jgi:hypothetical protein